MRRLSHRNPWVKHENYGNAPACRRLSNQQGRFLLNGAPGLSFEKSLRTMLGESADSALKRIAINRSTREVALRKLQQNEH